MLPESRRRTRDVVEGGSDAKVKEVEMTEEREMERLRLTRALRIGDD